MAEPLPTQGLRTPGEDADWLLEQESQTTEVMAGHRLRELAQVYATLEVAAQLEQLQRGVEIHAVGQGVLTVTPAEFERIRAMLNPPLFRAEDTRTSTVEGAAAFERERGERYSEPPMTIRDV